MADLVDKNILKLFVPISALNAENFRELATKTFVENVVVGEAIFKIGDNDRKSIYLINGQVEIKSDDGESKIIVAGTDAAKYALANQQPRKSTAIALVDSQIIRVDSDLLDILLAWDQLSGIEVDEIQVDEDSEDEDSWMTRILQSKAFLQVPPANIQAMFMRMEDIAVKAGDVIIKQDDDGDYYYIIKHGKCKVTQTSKTGSELTLATLGDGDAFGEEALLSQAKRNANIVMTTDGTLVRLAKEDFNELLKEPILSWVTNEEADAMMKERNTVWIDVRLESEHKNSGIEGSVNIPLSMLREKAQTLDLDKKYILYCDSGRRSSASAFLLSERGLQVYCLKGGLVERAAS